MSRPAILLATVVVVAWVALYLVTQLLIDPPLSNEVLLIAGLTVTTALILGFPSTLRGPRDRLVRGSRGHMLRLPRTPRDRDPAPVAVFGRDLPLRSGLTSEAAERTVRLLRPVLAGDAVAITDRESVLAFVGPGADHHLAGHRLTTAATRAVLTSGRARVLRHRADLGCSDPACPLQTAVVAPLRVGSRVVGTLKVFRLDGTPPARQPVQDLAGILSLHLELAEADRERQLAADARLNALRAQINPHFLFNVLNTIASKARTDPDHARHLLLRLSDFFRYSIRQDGQFAEFAQEYFFVRTYVSLEQARYGDSLNVRFDVDPQVLGVRVPVLTIQPLVENAVKHGLAEKVGGGTVILRARVDPLSRTTLIQVRDDGVGMPDDLLDRVLSGHAPSGGIGLHNINQRLENLFGERYSMHVQSGRDKGTSVDLRLPLR
jgi:two-component system LytT family sensor kinase